MKIAERYIFWEMLGPMLFGMAAFVSILASGKPLQELTNLAFQGVAIGQVLHLFALLLVPLVVLTLPMSMLLATLMGFGRLSGDSEMVAMYAGGFSLYRAAVPVVFLASFVTLLTVVLNERVVPWSIDQARAMQDRLEGQVKVQKQFILPQYDANDQLTMVLVADTFNPKTRVMEHVAATFYEKGQPARIASVKRAVYKDENNWVLEDGWVSTVGPGHTYPQGILTRQTIHIAESPVDIGNANKKSSEMSMRELRREIIRRVREGLPTAEYQVAWWNRWAVPFASVVFALVGLPLGLRPQRASGGLGLGLSIVIIFVYWVVWNYATKVGGDGALPPFIASWLANFLGLAAGGFLLARAPK